ncbi:MAG: hypothetical protein OMM_02659 [Candidatus Magnetoglobus multicellularis str. Araruama]|uniref:Orc1-like AAA ATPase domain-containing protein n=1 Tax=Candidatus Magnetoglobus multicellularis str. Araruama TaxID=890399 RepID=A0A1V1P8T3_9BACT|nr:MAG: hypothetical protein OMM_02659 [Candidatus Magnetoglobus multicellularis str. Araruama]
MFVQVYKTQKDTSVVGRHDFFKKILALLTIPDENGAFMFGQRCIGKTSALNAFCGYTHQNTLHIPVYIDPQELDETSPEKIVSEIMRCTAKTLKIDYEIADNPIDQFETHFLSLIHDKYLPDRRLVLCMDQFDLPDDTQTIHPFFLWFHDLLPRLRGEIFVIFTGGQFSTDLPDIYMPLFSDLRLFHLSCMSFDETLALVRHVERNNSIQWPEKIVQAIHDFSGGYPLIIDAICREFRSLPYGASPNETFSGVMLRYDKHMKWIWEGLSVDQKLVIACLAESDTPISQWQIEKRLDETRNSLFYERLKQAIQMLEIWQLIGQHADGYLMKCAFFSAWIREHHPVQTILKRADYIPLVSDYLYRAASFLFQTDRINDALKVGQHITHIHPKHIEANQMVADILIAEDHCIQAQKILEHLYQFKPDAARDRLINALKIQADALEALYSYSVVDFRHSPMNAHLKNIKLRYADLKDQNNHLLIVYEKILDLAPDSKDIHEKYIQLILKHQKIKDYQRKIAYEKDIQNHELSAYLLTEATTKVKQLQNRILFSQIYLKALDALLAGNSQEACDLFLRVVYMDEKCKDARRFLYLARHYSPEIENAIQESFALKPLPEKTVDDNAEIIVEADPISEQSQKNNILLWIFLLILIIVATYVMMDGSLK